MPSSSGGPRASSRWVLLGSIVRTSGGRLMAVSAVGEGVVVLVSTSSDPARLSTAQATSAAVQPRRRSIAQATVGELPPSPALAG